MKRYILKEQFAQNWFVIKHSSKYHFFFRHQNCSFKKATIKQEVLLQVTRIHMNIKQYLEGDFFYIIYIFNSFFKWDHFWGRAIYMLFRQPLNSSGQNSDLIKGIFHPIIHILLLLSYRHVAWTTKREFLKKESFHFFHAITIELQNRYKTIIQVVYMNFYAIIQVF